MNWIIQERMKKKIILFVSAILAMFDIIGVVMVVMYQQEYNSKGVSHYVIATMDPTQSKEFVGYLGQYSIYVEGLKIDDLYFVTVDGNSIPIKDAIKNEDVSLTDWKRNAEKHRQSGNTEILQFDNYEIAITDKECVFRPISE